MPSGRTNQGAFTLVELLIVVALIAIVATIMVPAIRSMRAAANEASAIQTLRGIASENQLHLARTGGYAPSLKVLAESKIGPGLRSDDGRPEAVGDVRSGYVLDAYSGSRSSWLSRTSPADPGVSGERSFYVDESAVIRQSESGPAGSGSPPLGGV